MRWEDTSSIVPNVPALKNHTATLIGSQIYIFGGYDGRRNHNDLHVFDSENMRWKTYVEAPSHSRQVFNINETQDVPRRQIQYLYDTIFPAGRNGHTATLADGKIYFLGGWLGSGPYAANDLHILHVGRELRWEQPNTTGISPGPCNMHTADYIPHIHGIIVFRGGDGREYLNDLHLLDVHSHHWSRPNIIGRSPSPRANHSSSVLENKIYYFGGWNGTNRLNDLHILTIDSENWHWTTVDTTFLPHPRAGMTFVCVRQRFFLFGGYGLSAKNYPAKCFNDLFVFDPSKESWTATNTSPSPLAANPNDEILESNLHLSIQGSTPCRRAGHTCTVVNRKLFIFGGSYDNEYLNDMHILDTDPEPNAMVITPQSVEFLLKNYINAPLFSDITFNVDGQRFHAHKLVLSLRSERFRALFSSGFLESSADIIDLNDVSAATFQFLLEYIYSGAFECSFDWHQTLELAIAADQYMLDHLKQLCEKSLQSFISIDTIADMLQGAEKANASQLESMCLHFVRNQTPAKYA